MNGKTRNERLRRLLRDADPTTDDPGLSPYAVREMRRTVLSAVPEPRRQWSLVPILAGAAAVMLALVVGLTIWPGSGSPTAPSRRPERVAVVPAQPAAPTLRATAQRAAAQTSETARRRPARRLPPRKRTATPAPTAIAEAQAHQIQFSTPGGTRIIWVLTSDEASE